MRWVARVVLLPVLILVATGCGKAAVEEAFAAFARNAAEGRAVLGKGATAAEIESMIATAKALPRAMAVAGGADEFLRAVGSSRDGVVSIVAHNDGGFLRFGNGTAVPIASVAGHIPRGTKRLVVLVGCNTASRSGGPVIGLKSQITTEAGVEILSRFQSWRKTIDGVPNELSAELELAAIADAVAKETNESLVRQGSRTRIIVSSVGAAGGAGLASVLLTEQVD